MSLAAAPVDEVTSAVAIGGLLGAYRVLSRLGSGGMGEVFLAEHARSGGRVAIKVLHARYAEDTQANERFVREARIASRVVHQHIVEATELDYLPDGRPYLVMEHVEGADVYALWQGHALSLDRFVRVMLQIAGALDAAHRAGVVHRDLKPSNLFLVEGQDYVKILDFGLAKLTQPGDERLTQTGQVIATPSYMSPEQATGEPVDGRSDLYSLGIVMWELLVGQRPFNGSSFGDFVLQHATTRPLPPSKARVRELNEPIPPALDALVLRCLAKRPEDRFASAGELYEALVALRAQRPRRTRRALVLAAAGALALFTGGLVAEGLRTSSASASRSPSPPMGSMSEPLATVEAAAVEPAAGDPATIEPVAVEPLPTMIINRKRVESLPPMIIDLPAQASNAAHGKRRKLARPAREDEPPSANLLKNPFAGSP